MKKTYTFIFAFLMHIALFATVHTITIASFVYTPSSLSINCGDTVRFTWVDGSHPTVSESGSWAAFTLSATTPTKDIVLTAAGSYPYYCNFHGAAGGVGMSGTITVTCPPPCSTPTGLSASGITSSMSTISWSAVSGATKYLLQFRVQGTSVWSKVSVSSTTKTLSSLTPNTTYQYRVKARCGSIYGAFTSIQTFTTLPMRKGEVLNTVSVDINPNPNNGLFTLQLNGFSGETCIDLFDINGNLIYSEKVKADTGVYLKEIDLTNIASPFVIVKVNDVSNTLYKKILMY